MGKARNGDVTLDYQSIGSGTPLLLLMGAGAQQVMWPRHFLAALAERGCQAVTMDLRDDGLSTQLADGVRYTARDIADDVVAVFDALGWSTGIVLGASMGGAFAQATAIHHPDRVRGLISVSSNPGTSLWLNRPRIGAMLRLYRVMSRRCADRDAEGRRWVDAFRVIGSPAYPLDVDHWRTAGRLAHDHGRNPRGQLRQFAAARSPRDRRPQLAELRVPTLVIHGEADPMVSIRAGRATAAAIPGARFVSYPGMGHDLPRELWPAMIDEITALAALSPTLGSDCEP
jgi:pimeloyl-ACP methyl ester carboxylesterase